MRYTPHLSKLMKLTVLGVSTIVFYCSTVAFVAAQASFFQGKTITLIQGRDPGGSGDLRTKAVATFVQKHLPGNPTVIMEYMPGAGGRKAANHLFRVAKPDGLTIGNPSIGMISSAVLGESGVQYDIDKFSYLGSPYSTYHCVRQQEAGRFSSLEKLQAATGIRISAQSVGFVTYNEGRLFAYILGSRSQGLSPPMAAPNSIPPCYAVKLTRAPRAPIPSHSEIGNGWKKARS